MKTEPKAIVIVVFCTILTSIGALLNKIGADRLELNIYSIVTNYPIMIALFLYVIAAMLLIYAYKHGELSVLFPFLAMSFVWVAIMSVIVLDEIMTLTAWMGIIAIVAGVTFVGRGSR